MALYGVEVKGKVGGSDWGSSVILESRHGCPTPAFCAGVGKAILVD
jgi:hypothetical protein